MAVGDRAVEVLIGQAGAGRFLVREAPEAALTSATTAPAARAYVAASGEGRAMAAGAPFGSAVIGGDDIFAGRAEEANAALAVLTGRGNLLRSSICVRAVLAILIDT